MLIFTYIISAHESVAPTPESTKCSLILSPRNFDQYRHFLIRVASAAYTPRFFSSAIPFKTQKPLFNTTTFTIAKIGVSILNSSPNFFRMSSYCFCPHALWAHLFLQQAPSQTRPHSSPNKSYHTRSRMDMVSLEQTRNQDK
jgi:hypothetical protein